LPVPSPCVQERGEVAVTRLDQALVEEGWEDLSAWLPGNLDELARQTGALKRRRVIRTGEALLRMSLGYSALELSLRGVSAWMSQHGLAEVSDVGVLKRLQRAPGFLQAVLTALLTGGLSAPSSTKLPYRVVLRDATVVSEPGSTGTDWRVHVEYDAARGCISRVEVTDSSGGEQLQRLPCAENELLVADRGYAHPRHIVAVRQAGAHVLVRLRHNTVKMFDEQGEQIDPLEWAQRPREDGEPPPRIEERPVLVRAEAGAVEARLFIVRRSQEEADKERERLRKRARRKGEKVSERTLEAAAYVFFLTTVPQHEASAAVLAELYRVRWQVELLFKRLKSLLDLDALRAHDEDLVLTYLLGKLITAVLTERIARQARAFSPFGLPISPLPANLCPPTQHLEMV
jgi:hypothetical protein